MRAFAVGAICRGRNAAAGETLSISHTKALNSKNSSMDPFT